MVKGNKFIQVYLYFKDNINKDIENMDNLKQKILHILDHF
jgi:hypothetical protein